MSMRYEKISHYIKRNTNGKMSLIIKKNEIVQIQNKTCSRLKQYLQNAESFKYMHMKLLYIAMVKVNVKVWVYSLKSSRNLSHNYYLADHWLLSIAIVFISIHYLYLVSADKETPSDICP